MGNGRIFPVIMAGGASSRLWPASGKAKPKWDLRLFGAQSLLEGAWERARSVAPAADCFIVTGGAQADLVRRSIPELPPQNLLVEPEPRDTAGAVAFSAGVVSNRMNASGAALENGVLFILAGDHIIRPVATFAACAKIGASAAVEHKTIVTFGIVPRKPSTAYGYVQKGAALAANNSQVLKVSKFREKPDKGTAEQYVASGEYFWNGGIFLFNLQTLRDELQRQLPGHEALCAALEKSPANEQAAHVARHFPELKKTSIDFGIMEHAQNVAMVVADFEWDDIGSWSAVADHVEHQSGNALGPGTQLLQVDAQKNLVYAPGKRVALIGVEGLAVVESDGQILVCRLDRDQDVKKISEQAK